MSVISPPPPRSSRPPMPQFESKKQANLYPLCMAAVFGFAIFLVVVVGGILFPVSTFEKKKKVEVEQELDISNLKKPETEQPKEEVEQEKEPPPPAPIMENVNIAAPAMDDAPALSPMSLSDLESALAPGGGGGMFGGRRRISSQAESVERVAGEDWGRTWIRPSRWPIWIRNRGRCTSLLRFIPRLCDPERLTGS